MSPGLVMLIHASSSGKKTDHIQELRSSPRFALLGVHSKLITVLTLHRCKYTNTLILVHECTYFC